MRKSASNESVNATEITFEMIRERAYQLYLERGEDSNEEQNWKDAEEQLKQEQNNG